MRKNETVLCPHCGQKHPPGTTYCPIHGLPIEGEEQASRLTTLLDSLATNKMWLIVGAAVIAAILCLAVFVTLTVFGGRSKLPTTPTLVIILPSLLPGSNNAAPTPNQVVSTPTPSVSATPDTSPWQACPDAVYLSRIHVGNTVAVSSDPPLANRVRRDASLDAEVVGYIEPGEQSLVLDGPRCANQWVWWKVQSTSNGVEGWTAEGDAENYWLVPVSP